MTMDFGQFTGGLVDLGKMFGNKLLDATENIHGGVGYVPGRGVVAGLDLSGLAQARAQRKRAESLYGFFQDYMGGVQAGDITPENYYNKVADMLANERHRNVITDDALKLSGAHQETLRNMSPDQKELFDTWSKATENVTWDQLPARAQKALMWGWGITPEDIEQGATPPGLERRMNPHSGQSELYFPDRAERKAESYWLKRQAGNAADLDLERAKKEGGFGVYNDKPFDAEEVRQREEIKADVRSRYPASERKRSLMRMPEVNPDTGKATWALRDPLSGDFVAWGGEIPKQVGIMDQLLGGGYEDGSATPSLTPAGSGPAAPEPDTDVIAEKVIGGKRYVQKTDGQWYEAD